MQWTNHTNSEEKIICGTKTPLLYYELLVVLLPNTSESGFLCYCSLLFKFYGIIIM